MGDPCLRMKNGSGRDDAIFELEKKTPRLSQGRISWQNCYCLEQVPEELVVDFVVELHF